MAKSLKLLAAELTTLSALMEGRDKVETEDIIKVYPNGITIADIDEIGIGEERFYVYTFKEDNNKFAFSGHILSKIFDGWVTAYDGDVGEVRKLLRTENVKLQLANGKTKQGRSVTTVKVL